MKRIRRIEMFDSIRSESLINLYYNMFFNIDIGVIMGNKRILEKDYEQY